MKSAIIWVIIFLTLAACGKKESIDNIIGSEIDDPDTLTGITGLSLYWDHEIFGKEGRRVRFEFYSTTEHRYFHELVFSYTISANRISVDLIDTMNRGECGVFPTASGIDSLCASKGGFYIPDTLLDNGIYEFELNTDSFNVEGSFVVSDNAYQLQVPENVYFTSSIENVYSIPEEIIMGSIVFSGEENIDEANKLKEELGKLGLLNTDLPNYPYRHLLVNDDGVPADETWPPENYLFGLLYRSNGISFKDIVAVAENMFTTSELNIYLYSGMGDEARFSQSEGIYIVYAGE